MSWKSAGKRPDIRSPLSGHGPGRRDGVSSQRQPAPAKVSAKPADLLEVGWLLVAVLVPLWFNPWAKQTFEPSKVALARSLIWLLGVVWLSRHLIAGRSPWPGLRSNPLLWPVVALAGVLVFATAFAVDPGLSLWGTYERGQGLITQASYLILFLVVGASLVGYRQGLRLAVVLVLGATPLVVVGLAQAAGWDYGQYATDARSPVRATLGRANFLGAYLAMLLPLAIAVAFSAGRRVTRLGYAVVGLAMLLTVLLTQARGAWLAGAVALGVFALAYYWPNLSRPVRVTAVVVSSLVLVCGLGLVWWFGREGGSTAARLVIWQAVLNLVSARPFLGYGPETLGLVFPQVFPPELAYYQGRNVLVDRAHNVLLDWAFATGAVGLLAWLAVLAVFAGVTLRALNRVRAGESRLLFAASLAAVAGNQAGNLAGFDVTATSIASWLLMALGLSLAHGEEVSSQAVEPGKSTAAWRWAAAGLLLGLALTAVYAANLKPVLADVAAKTAAERASARDWVGAATKGAEAVALWPLEPSYRQDLSWAYFQRTRNAGAEAAGWLDRAERELLAARDMRPLDFRVWWALGELYSAWGGLFDAQKLTAADAAYARAATLAPNHAQLYTGWALVDLTAGRPADAVDKARHATGLDATDPIAFIRLGDALLAAGRPAEALDAYGIAYKLDPKQLPARLGMAYAYRDLGKPQPAREVVAEVLRLSPDNQQALDLRRQLDGP